MSRNTTIISSSAIKIFAAFPTIRASYQRQKFQKKKTISNSINKRSGNIVPGRNELSVRVVEKFFVKKAVVTCARTFPGNIFGRIIFFNNFLGALYLHSINITIHRYIVPGRARETKRRFKQNQMINMLFLHSQVLVLAKLVKTFSLLGCVIYITGLCGIFLIAMWFLLLV